MFVGDLFSAYLKYADNLGLKAELLDSGEGHVVAQLSGKNVWKAFQNEAGKHIVQRNPPTENKGRRHTSVVAVAILPLAPEKKAQVLREDEFETIIQRGHGPGGQNINKTASFVKLRHKKTGILVSINGRSQLENKRLAMRILTARVNELAFGTQKESYDSHKKVQLGNTGRGEKIRTYNFIRGEIVDHKLNKSTRDIKTFMKGRFNVLFE